MATPKEQHDAHEHPINFGENAPDAALQKGDTPVPPESAARTGHQTPVTGGGSAATGGRGTGTSG